MNRTLLIVFGIVTWAALLLLIFDVVHVQRSLKQMEAMGAAHWPFAQIERAQRDAALVSERTAEAVRELDILQARIEQLQARLTDTSPRRPRGPVTTFLPTFAPAARQGRAWGPEQVIGPPDTMQAGDVSTAWAPRQPDGGGEWLNVDYERETQVSEVIVRETYNPGAIVKVTAILP